MDKQTGKKKSRLWIVILGVVVLLGAGAAFFFSTYLLCGGQVISRNAASADLRGKNVSAAQYEELCSKLPTAEILWDVPFGSERVDCRAETAVLSALNSDNLSGLRYLPALRELDARNSVLTEADFLAIRELLPNCHVLWSIPLGQGRYASDADSVELDDFTAEDVARFDYFENLTTADCRHCTVYDGILALREAYPALNVLWQVPISGESYPQDAQEIRVDSTVTAAGELQTLLRCLPEVRVVSAPGCIYSEEEKMTLAEAYPAVRFHWPVTLLGCEYTGEETELSFAGQSVSDGDYQELLSKLRCFSELKTVDMTDCSLTDEQVFALADTIPEADVIWSFTFYDVPVSTTDTFLDLTGIPLESTEELEAIFPYMHHLEKVDMTDCGFSDEEMDALNKKYEDIRIVWTLYIMHYKIRTDDKGFRGTSNYYSLFDEESIKRLAYCEDMVALDMGHRTVPSLEFVRGMPHLKYLVLYRSGTTDLSPLSACKELSFLEMVDERATDLSPLLECPSLRSLNISFLPLSSQEETFEVLSKLTWVKRVWYTYEQLTDEQVEELRQINPDTMYVGNGTMGLATSNPWRYDQDYYDMRDILGMFYMNCEGRINYKIIDGVRIDLDPEFIAQQGDTSHDKDR